MKSTSLRILKLALTVLFITCVLLVPSLVAAAESPRGMWMAEWLRPYSIERTVGVLTLRDGKLAFSEQAGQDNWQVALTDIKRVATVNGGRAILVVTMAGERYVAAIMEANLTPRSSKSVLATVENALRQIGTNSR